MTPRLSWLSWLALLLLLLPALAGAAEPELTRVRYERESDYVLQHRLASVAVPHEQRRQVRLVTSFVCSRTTTHATLHFERWRREETRTRAPRVDESLGGRRVQFELESGRFEVLDETPEQEPISLAARRYLKREAEELRRPLARLFLPDLEPGREAPSRWSPPLAPIAKRLVLGARLDAERSKLELVLSQGKGASKLAGSGHLQLRTFPGSAETQVAKGGRFQLEVELAWKPGLAPERVSRSHSASFRATGHDQRPDGEPIQLRVKASERESRAIEAYEAR